MKELLFLAHRIPYPPDKGDKIRSFHLLRHLAPRYTVHLGAFIDDARDWSHVASVKEMCGETRFVALQPGRAKARSLAALATGEPLTLRYFHDAALSRWVADLLAARRIERALVFSSAMAQYLEAIPAQAMRRVLDFVDLDSDKWRQYGERSRGPLRWLYRREAETLFRAERRYAAAFDASLFVSDAEARLFADQAPESAARVSVVKNGVDTDYFSPQRAYPDPFAAGEAALVFTGAMDYWANVDAVVWFAREVLPRVRSDFPQACFYVVGARPSRAVLDLAQLPGVKVTGTVPDTRPYLAHARAAVAPLRMARGVQNKVLEAMAMARPVVASPQAVAGIGPCAELREWSSDAPDAMARSLARLLRDAAPAGLGEALRAHVLRHYGWSDNLARVEAILEGTH
ncbi:MAG TPA: TIGR03087 family PEP-CTERM/XrtA system glycosyltransferase [Burkholderiales bacterium]|nr:TIGR03087 family PEP-CTERM/XrtA system glycosyltransferase [Burkholderiales bacterium]